MDVIGASFRKLKLRLALTVLVGFQFELGVPNITPNLKYFQSTLKI